MDLTNQFLVATPQIKDRLFERTVIYVCQHDHDGTMGIVVNRATNARLEAIFSQLDIGFSHSNHAQDPVYAGGPVHPEHGFILHSPIGSWKSSMIVTDQLAVTTSKDILEALADNQGPTNYMISLGYAGWDQEQIEQEISRNDWFVIPADETLIFNTPVDKRWEAALACMGIHDIATLSSFSGHA